MKKKFGFQHHNPNAASKQRNSVTSKYIILAYVILSHAVSFIVLFSKRSNTQEKRLCKVDTLTTV